MWIVGLKWCPKAIEFWTWKRPLGWRAWSQLSGGGFLKTHSLLVTVMTSSVPMYFHLSVLRSVCLSKRCPNAKLMYGEVPFAKLFYLTLPKLDINWALISLAIIQVLLWLELRLVNHWRNGYSGIYYRAFRHKQVSKDHRVLSLLWEWNW